MEDRWIPWRSSDAVYPQLEIASQAFEPAGLLCDLGSNQLSLPNGFLVELANPPVATCLQSVEHIEVEREDLWVSFNSVDPSYVRLRER